MCDIEELMGGGQIQHWFDNEEKEYIVSAMKNRQDAVSENNNSNHIWSTFISVGLCVCTVYLVSFPGFNLLNISNIYSMGGLVCTQIGVLSK